MIFGSKLSPKRHTHEPKRNRFSYSNLFHKRNSIMSIFIALYLLPPLHLFLYVTATNDYLLPYSPTDLILLNCGASSNLSSPDGRSWDGDSQPKFAASNPPEASSVFEASTQDPSVDQVPYKTALSAIRPPVDSFTKEFIITVWDNQKLELTFIPSPASFAFVNGIEIVSMPDSFYARGNDNSLTYVGTAPFYLGNTTALETVYRLNVGGQYISSTRDTGMYRTWHQDSEYLFRQAGNIPYLPGVKINHRWRFHRCSICLLSYSLFLCFQAEASQGP
ncbi:hypothetical protein NC651_037132 [Populus alba x Populus x berolinensis]|nr:hypothetical protein NC651_037132 [Populus alba x Populus x berolinensis]